MPSCCMRQRPDSRPSTVQHTDHCTGLAARAQETPAQPAAPAKAGEAAPSPAAPATAAPASAAAAAAAIESAASPLDYSSAASALLSGGALEATVVNICEMGFERSQVQRS